jgi:hypothetical protein
MMVLDGYQLYQVERPKSARERQHADEQAARFVAAASWPFLAIARAVRRPPSSGVKRGVSPAPAAPAACRGAMAR